MGMLSKASSKHQYSCGYNTDDDFRAQSVPADEANDERKSEGCKIKKEQKD